MKFSMTGQEKGDLLNTGDYMGRFDCICEITEISIYLPSQTEDTICALYLVFQSEINNKQN